MRRGRSRKFHRLGEVLPRVMKRLNLDRVVQEQRVVEVWPEVVGEKIAQHTRATSMQRGVLLVLVDNPGWMTQLTFLKPELLRKLAPRARKGIVKDIRFRLSR